MREDHGDLNDMLMWPVHSWPSGAETPIVTAITRPFNVHVLGNQCRSVAPASDCRTVVSVALESELDDVMVLPAQDCYDIRDLYNDLPEARDDGSTSMWSCASFDVGVNDNILP